MDELRDAYDAAQLAPRRFRQVGGTNVGGHGLTANSPWQDDPAVDAPQPSKMVGHTPASQSGGGLALDFSGQERLAALIKSLSRMPRWG